MNRQPQKTKSHWTNASTKDFLFKIGSGFIRQLEDAMEGITQTELAARLGVSEGRVSQVLNNPGNLTLKNVIQYGRALGRKVAIIAYDDGDVTNDRGPIDSEVFNICWQRAGKPVDFFDLDEKAEAPTPRLS